MSSNIYTISHADNNPRREFKIYPYTSDGPASPLTGGLDDTATVASTTLVLTGKGLPQYGEHVINNQLNMLEHFAAPTAPVYPIAGQMWFNTSLTPAQMMVYSRDKFTIQGSNIQGDVIVLDDGGLFDTAIGHQVWLTNPNSNPIDHERYTVIAIDTTNNAPNTTVTIYPAPPASRVTWKVSGWEYIHQDNAPKHSNLNMGGFDIVNVGSGNGTAATTDYVDNAVAIAIQGNDTLDELTDVIAPSPSANDILLYDGNNWISSTIANTDALSVQGTNQMLADLNAGGYFITNVLYPVATHHAANKQYVDDQIVAVAAGTASELNDLNDVVVGNIQGGTFMYYTGSIWTAPTNISEHSNMLRNADIMQLSGAEMTAGYLMLYQDPQDPMHAATKQYVDGINIALNDQTGYIVDDAIYDPLTGELTLTRVNGIDPIVITGLSTASGGSSTHTIDHPDTPHNETGLAFEAEYGVITSEYPDISVDDILWLVNRKLGSFIPKKQRAIFTSTGAAEYDLDLSQFGDIGFTLGRNTAMVTVNGQKQYIGDNYFVRISDDSVNESLYWESTPTGLLAGTFYSFTISANGGPAEEIEIDGASAANYGLLLNLLNRLASDSANGYANPLGWTVILYDGDIEFWSTTFGSSSSITITDGSTLPATVPLFNTLNPDFLFESSDTFGLTLQDRDYQELPLPGTIAMIGQYASVIRFNAGSIPPIGSTIEVLVDQDPYGYYQG